MDHVDSTLRTILREVNTLEEFEKEKAIFQVNFGQFLFIEFFRKLLICIKILLKYFGFLRSFRIAPNLDGKYTCICISLFLVILLRAQEFKNCSRKKMFTKYRDLVLIILNFYFKFNSKNMNYIYTYYYTMLI